MSRDDIKSYYKVMFTEYPDILNVAQVQKMLRISRHLAYEMITNGSIPGLKIGNAYRIPKVNVINYMLNNSVQFPTDS